MHDSPPTIERPDDPGLAELCHRLRALASRPGVEALWPAAQLELCARYGIYRWFVDAEWRGLGWSDEAVIRAYLRLSAACLTTTFILTQRTGACRRIAHSENDWARSQLLPGLVSGESFATLGISHLTTSRRHLRQPVLRARPGTNGGFVLDGYAPWVSGARHAETIVTGATLADGQQILVALPTSLAGVRVGDDHPLLGLAGSATAELHCDGVELGREWLLAGPSANIMRQGIGARTGGLQTTTLALGLAETVIAYLEEEARTRADLRPASAGLRARHDALCTELFAAAAGAHGIAPGELRLGANELVVRAATAALVAAKGAGYLHTHPASRWLREAHFFLVWSLPAPVAEATLARCGGVDARAAAGASAGGAESG
ncbi:MAG: acyl-CoA/acyl-ACP dehydrogenase [Myxococcales bacterium]|nr:acyl-CoA/acyl-ACP dehydrogenase [Myxococcales bacterium]